MNHRPRETDLRVLVVTGRLAEESVRRSISELGMDVDVRALPISVAAFITPAYAADALGDVKAGDYDVILLPGMVRGDVSPVEEATRTPTFKGPVHPSDLPIVIGLLDEIELSKTSPASELIRDARTRRAASEIEEAERNWREILKEHGGLVIGGDGYGVPVGGSFPMRVIAEIVNAPNLDEEAVKRRAAYYESQGADIIDIGMLAGVPKPEAIGGLVEAVRSSVTLPISIDTLDPGEIEGAVDAGVDLVLSVDRGNLEEVANYVSDTPVVVLPSNMKEGALPERAEERFIALEENILLARNLGVGKIIADPVLEPAVKPGLIESLKAYQLFRLVDDNTPMLFGLGNVTEMIDADSTGVNALLTALACEVGANLLFVPEYSPKARGSVRETAAASKMMYLAERRKAPPKDLGLDLLVLKEKRWKEEPYVNAVGEDVTFLDARGDEVFKPDEMGWFKVKVDRENDLIVATHFRESSEPDVVVRGVDATEMYQTIIRMGLVGRLDHAAYLGKELVKAEMALKLGRSYIQDEPLL
jgi:dihydropteroate synthase-like protein